MKNIFAFLMMVVMLASCQTRVVSSEKPMQSNSLELYKRYTIQTTDAQQVKLQVLRQDSEKIYGKTKTGEEVVLNKSDIREAKKLDVLSSVAIAVAAVAAVIFVPI